MMKLQLRLITFTGLLVMLFGVFFSISNVEAQSSYFNIIDPYVRSCSESGYIVAMGLEWERADNHRIWYGTTEPDGAQSFTLSSLNNRTSPIERWTIGYNFNSQQFPYETDFRYSIIDLDGNEIGYVSVWVQCVGPNRGFASVHVNTFTAPLPTDGRVNSQHGDFEAIAYSVLDESGNYRLDVYCWDETTGTSSLGFSATLADVAATELGGVVASAPCGATLYRLISDEIQLNVLYDGETYVMVDNDLDFIDARQYRE